MTTTSNYSVVSSYMGTINDKTTTSTSNDRVNVLIIPYPAPSHVTPLVDLTRRLLNHHDNRLTVTFLTTPSTSHLLQPLLSSFQPPLLQPLVLSLPPSSSPQTTPISRILALHALLDPTISWCESHPTSPPRVVISDFLCTWTHQLSSCLNVPRVVFYSSGAFGSAAMYSVWRAAPAWDPFCLDIVLDDVAGSPVFKWSELSFLFRGGKPGDSDWDRFRAELLGNLTSWAAVFNTCSELEKVYIDHFMKNMGHDRVWAVGPLLQNSTGGAGPKPHEVITWLDGKRDCSVVYVCFGTRTSLSVEESTVLRTAIEYSRVNFVWCVGESETPHEINSSENGFVIKGWAPQVDILKHRAVGGFLTHCGWNSVIESILFGVVMVAWPMGSDQYYNAHLVVDQLNLGFKVKRYEPKGVPDPQELAQMLTDSVNFGRPERDRVIKLGKLAAETVENGGTSTVDFDRFITRLNEL